mmetsp:Transcript_49760/g.73089  ORF Transcript_49760/g.73089 Transcript_49760/m.73089 type:complete len:138 (-) Transcript_49760:42-455(-)
MASKAWSLSRVFVKALTASTRGVWRGGAGLPPAPQLALAGVQQQQQPANTQTLGQALNDLLGALWLAVPKKRTTPARRNQRSAPKYLRWDHSIISCVKCGNARRPHSYCDKFNCGKPDVETLSTAKSTSPDPDTPSK